MKNVRRNSWKSGVLGLSKTTSQDSCLDHIDETLSCATSSRDRKKQCYSVPSEDHVKRRATIVTTSPGSSLLEISKTGSSGSSKFLSFFHKGFHSHKSKSSSKIESDKTQSAWNLKSTSPDSLRDIIPIPIRETAIQGHTRTLYHRVPNSNLRAKPLITLSEDTKIQAIHPSILSTKYSFCVKILSTCPNVYRDSSKYELTLPTGTKSLGQTFRFVSESEERCPSTHSSQSSLFCPETPRRQTVGYVFSCTSALEQKKWSNVLTRIAKPNQQNERRKEISLNLWIQEAKNVTMKKRYYCEIYLDGGLYARTTTKMMGDMLFWGEEFNLCNLDEVNVLTLILWKCSEESRGKKKKSQLHLICQINIATKDIDQRTSVERWYSSSSNYILASPETPPFLPNQGILSPPSISSSVPTPSINHSSMMIQGSNDNVPMLRIKARYQHLDVLPLSSYDDLVRFLGDHAVKILTEIEPYLKVKAKEDLAQNLIKIIHKRGIAVPILCDLIINEISKSDDKNLILRGNTMASKAMEIFIKLVGDKYLQLTLSDFIQRVLLGQDDCEVDPQKSDRTDLYGGCPSPGGSGDKCTVPQYSLQQRQESLLMNVDMVWAKIMSSSLYFPRDLKAVFVTLRQRLLGSTLAPSLGSSSDQQDLCDRIISACIFLRYICPAILTPSLFGLIPDYPDNARVTRTFTLVAKCIQTLANFTGLCGTKETYMVFMNTFIENNFKTMRDFLREISGHMEPENVKKNTEPASQTQGDTKDYLYWDNVTSNLPEDTIDLALCLATFHRQMEEYLTLIGSQNLSPTMRALLNILEDVNLKLTSPDPGVAPSLKTSHSYQNMKAPTPPTTQEFQKRASVDAVESTVKRNKNSGLDSRPVQGGRLRPGKPWVTRATSNSAESTPTHQVPGGGPPPPSESAMSQSMMETSSTSSSQTTRSLQTKDVQVDKEWKAMLSASYAYNKCEDLFFGGDPELKSSVSSSGYQTLARSSESLPGSSRHHDEVLVTPKSPSLSLKPSVKKCKQVRRMTEVLPRLDSFQWQTRVQTPESRDVPRHHDPKSVSSEEIQTLWTHPALYRHQEEDSSSTQTLTGIKMEPDLVQEDRTKMVNSISMPAFLSFQSHSHQSPAFFTSFRGLPAHSCIHSSSSSSSSSSSRSAFRDPGKLRPDPGTMIETSDSFQIHQDTEEIKSSLQNLRQTLNSRMKELLLADRTTIQLELERVKLMGRICDSPGSSGPISSKTVILFYDYKNGSVSCHDPLNSKPISIKKYLEIAEKVLEDAYNTHSKTNHNKTSVLEKEMEDILVQIFQTNQYLQNSLMTKNEKGGSSDISSKQLIDQNVYPPKKSQPLCRGQRPTSSKTSMENLKSSSLGSLATRPSTSSSSSAMIEIIDAV